MPEKIPFEKQMERIDHIVKTLEHGDVSLEASLELFEEGAKLVKECNRILDTAEKKVMLLMSDYNRMPKEVPFDREENSNE